jgi:molybdate/tungstate transport system ATP-binding protein
MLLTVDKIFRAFNDFEMNDVSFDVQKGQYFVLLGASGTGKSVLLEIVAGLIRPDAGRIFLNGKDITDVKIQKRNISLVFQNGTLFPHMTVFDNIAYPLRYIAGKSRIPKLVDKLAEDLGVTNLLKRKPQTLSGGESQRVSLARAIASKPECLLLDEPLSSLDARSRPQMRTLLRKINAEGQTIIHVTHDYTEAVSLGTHIAVMEEGTIVQVGTAEDIFQYPKSEFVARFIGVRNFFKGQLKEPAHHLGLKKFQTGGLAFSVLTDSPAGAGFVCIRSEDVTILNTSAASEPTSARNNFSGTIVDIVRNGLGLEVIVDIGENTKQAVNRNNFEIAALISSESAQLLDLTRGKKVYISFKASAVKYVED